MRQRKTMVVVALLLAVGLSCTVEGTAEVAGQKSAVQERQPQTVHTKRKTQEISVQQRPEIMHPERTTPKLSVKQQPQEEMHTLEVPGTGAEKADLLQGRMVAYGWQEYEQENYVRARDFFLRASRGADRELRSKARIGLAYSQLQLGNRTEALTLFKQLVSEEPMAEAAVIETLAGLLEETGELETLERLLPRLDPEAQKSRQQRIREQRFVQAATSVLDNKTPQAAAQLIDQYPALLTDCHQTETFFKLARLAAQEEREQGKRFFQQLGRCRQNDRPWQQRIVQEQLALLETDALVHLTRKDTTPWGPATNFQAQIETALWQRLEQSKPGSPVRVRLLQALARINPDDPRIMEMESWACYKHKNYTCSRRIFKQLLNKRGDVRDLEGLALSLQQLNQPEQALSLITSHSELSSPTVVQLAHDLHLDLGTNLYQQRKYRAAAEHLSQALILAPGDPDAEKLYLWSLYKTGKPEPLLNHLLVLVKDKGQREDARLLADLVGASENEALQRQALETFEHSSQPDIRALAARILFDRGEVIRAARLRTTPGPWSGCDRPAVDVMAWFDDRNGDQGTSSLETTALLMQQRWVDRAARIFTLSLWPMRLYSGELPAGSPVGTDLPGRTARPGLWEDEEQGLGWRLAVNQEGAQEWGGSIGTTPLGVELNPVIVGELWAKGEGWSLTLSRNPVRESLLSWVGQTDPYGLGTWGRVVESSLEAEKVLTRNNKFMSIKGKASLYRGHRVENNQSFTGTISIGQTVAWGRHQLSLGGFVFGRSFTRNSDFFTFGHGGYYSPELQVVGGPFLHLATTPDQPWWLEINLSLGYDHRRTADAPRYRELDSGGISVLESEDNPVYRGEEDDGLGIDARIRTMVPLGRGWFAGGEAMFSTVGEYSRWHGGLLLSYRFGDGMGLGRPEGRLDRMTGLLQ